jgi:cytochrome bd-type quinol oxidase subunit 1
MREGNAPDESASTRWSGLIAVVVTTVVIGTIAVIALYLLSGKEDDTTRVAVATAAFGVISSIVSAYLGVKLGGENAKTATTAATTLAASSANDAKQAHARVGALLQYVDPSKVSDATAAADRAASAVRG